MTRYILGWFGILGRRVVCRMRGHEWRIHTTGRICARCYRDQPW